MLNTSAGLWPNVAANSPEIESTDPWGLGSVFETQARLWNHLLDANRSLWELYAPWLTAGPSLWNPALAPLAREDAGEEPAQTVDGVPDALETQARTWNHLLDANRNFWNAFGFMPGNGAAEVSEQAPEEPAQRAEAPVKKRAAKKSTRPRAG